MAFECGLLLLLAIITALCAFLQGCKTECGGFLFLSFSFCALRRVIQILRYVYSRAWVSGSVRAALNSFEIAKTIFVEKEADLYWELESMARTRKTIQGKPIRIRVSAQTSKLEPGKVVFVNSKDGYQHSTPVN